MALSEWCVARDVSVQADPLTVVVDGVGDDGAERSGALAAVVLQEDLDAQPHHVQVVLLRLQQLLVWHWGHTGQVSLTHTGAGEKAPKQRTNEQGRKTTSPY